jgi:hypothetical protein
MASQIELGTAGTLNHAVSARRKQFLELPRTPRMIGLDGAFERGDRLSRPVE